MKRTYLPAVLSLLLSLFLPAAASAQDDPPAEPDPNFHIYLCFGQSNMGGQGEITEADQQVVERLTMLAAVNQPKFDRVRGRWYPATPPLALEINQMGPADAFGRAMVEALPDDQRVGLVVVAVGGTKIELFQPATQAKQDYLDGAPDWLRQRAAYYDDDPYARLVEMGKVAQQYGVIKGFLLHQGESNTGEPGWAEKVADVYTRLCNDLDLDAKNVPLLAGEVVNATENGVCASFNENQLPELPKLVPTAHIVSSADCPAKDDNLHFTKAGYEMLGQRYAAKMLELQSDEQAAEHAAAPLQPPVHWEASGELIPPPEDTDRPVVAIKDPSIVFHDGKYHVIATVARPEHGWQMVYLSFDDWASAKDAEPHFMDIVNPGLRGYHCAPQVFWFEPHKKWYLVFQSQQPQYCTTDDLSDPSSWSEPKDFFDGKPDTAPRLWIDYFVIADESHAYLFFTGDDGKLYRSRTELAQFPNGMSEPEIVLEDENRFNLFEGSAHYKLQGTDQYLTIIEAIGPGGRRWYRAWTHDSLDGEMTPLADTWDDPFASTENITYADGVEPWTQDISHGELLRVSPDQTMTVDPANLQLLFQGREPSNEQIDYIALPYRLGLLTLKAAD